MRAMLIGRAVLWPAILSATAALGCASPPKEGDVDGDGLLTFDDARKRHYLEAFEAAQYPPCGTEMPFSLALDTNDYLVPAHPIVVAADYSYRDTDPATVQITWGDNYFIAFNLNTSFPKDGKGLFYVEGSLALLEPTRDRIWPVMQNSVLLMEEKAWKFYLAGVDFHVAYWGILCDNRTSG
jgi:hypothetical protein